MGVCASQNQFLHSKLTGLKYQSFIPIDLRVGWYVANQAYWAGHNEARAKMWVQNLYHSPWLVKKRSKELSLDTLILWCLWDTQVEKMWDLTIGDWSWLEKVTHCKLWLRTWNRWMSKWSYKVTKALIWHLQVYQHLRGVKRKRSSQRKLRWNRDIGENSVEHKGGEFHYCGNKLHCQILQWSSPENRVFLDLAIRSLIR